MKTFRCVFIGDETRVVDVTAPDAAAAVRKAAANSPTLSFDRIDVEDERGRLFVAPSCAGQSAKGRVRVFPVQTAA